MIAIGLLVLIGVGLIASFAMGDDYDDYNEG